MVTIKLALPQTELLSEIKSFYTNTFKKSKNAEVDPSSLNKFIANLESMLLFNKLKAKDALQLLTISNKNGDTFLHFAFKAGVDANVLLSFLYVLSHNLSLANENAALPKLLGHVKDKKRQVILQLIDSANTSLSTQHQIFFNTMMVVNFSAQMKNAKKTGQIIKNYLKFVLKQAANSNTSIEHISSLILTGAGTPILSLNLQDKSTQQSFLNIVQALLKKAKTAEDFAIVKTLLQVRAQFDSNIAITQQHLRLMTTVISARLSPDPIFLLNTLNNVVTNIMHQTSFSINTPIVTAIIDLFKTLNAKSETHATVLSFLEQALLDNAISPQWKNFLASSLPFNLFNENIKESIVTTILNQSSVLDATRIQREYKTKENNKTLDNATVLIMLKHKIDLSRALLRDQQTTTVFRVQPYAMTASILLQLANNSALSSHDKVLILQSLSEDEKVNLKTALQTESKAITPFVEILLNALANRNSPKDITTLLKLIAPAGITDRESVLFMLQLILDTIIPQLLERKNYAGVESMLQNIGHLMTQGHQWGVTFDSTVMTQILFAGAEQESSLIQRFTHRNQKTLMDAFARLLHTMKSIDQLDTALARSHIQNLINTLPRSRALKLASRFSGFGNFDLKGKTPTARARLLPRLSANPVKKIQNMLNAKKIAKSAENRARAAQVTKVAIQQFTQQLLNLRDDKLFDFFCKLLSDKGTQNDAAYKTNMLYFLLFLKNDKETIKRFVGPFIKALNAAPNLSKEDRTHAIIDLLLAGHLNVTHEGEMKKFDEGKIDREVIAREIDLIHPTGKSELHNLFSYHPNAHNSAVHSFDDTEEDRPHQHFTP